MIKYLLTSLLCLSTIVALAQKKAGKANRPNIVYILADDLGYGELGSYGQQKIKTPNIDQLARNGMRFTQHYTFPVCAPSRYALMTGQHSGRAYIRGNDEWTERGPVWDFKAMEANPFLEGQRPIPDSTLTIAEICKAAGYTTGMVGKWGLGAPFSTGHPNRQGFDYFYGFICQRQDHTYYTGHLWENQDRVVLSNRVIDPATKLPDSLDPLNPASYVRYQQQDYTPDFLLQAAVQFINKNKDKPFFLYYPSPLPHLSLQAPQRWVDIYHAQFGEEQPFLGGSYFPCRYPRATYAAMISTLDEQVGQLITALKAASVYDNTIIMFCSDNGPAGNQGVDPQYFNSGGPLPAIQGRGKGYLFEAGIREPFIVQWPGKVPAATTTDHLSANIDMVPTLCELLGLKSPANIDGISLLPTLLGKPQQQRQHDYLYWEFPEYGGQQAVRRGKWKAIRLNLMKGIVRTALYDLEKDIREEHDLAAQYPAIVQQLEAIMLREHRTPQVSTFRIPVLEH